MAPLVVFAMWALQWQCSSAVKMMRMKTYSDSGCTAANMQEDNWVPTEECKEGADNLYYKLTCNGDNGVSTLYSDSKCTTKKPDATAAGYVKGVADPKDKCVSYADGGNEWSTISCANQPTIATFVAYSDSSCKTAADGGAKNYVALNFCEFKYKRDNGKFSTELDEANKVTVTGDKLESKDYTTKDCSDAGTVKVTGTLPCVEVDKGKVWYTVETSGSSAAASSSTSASSSNTTASNATASTGSASSAPLQYLSLCTFILSVTLAAFAL